MSNEAVNEAPAGANPGDVTKSGCYEMYKEILVLGYHLWTVSRNTDDGGNYAKPLANFNGKAMFQGEYAFGQQAQVGPDNSTSQQIDIVIDDLNNAFQDLMGGLAAPPWNNIDGRMTENDYLTIGQNMITLADDKLNKVSNIRTELGVQDNRLQHVTDDLMAQYINISAGRSRIQDADFAQEATALAKNQIITQSSGAAAAQANAQPLKVMDLLDAIYNGLSPDLANPLRQGNTS
jgi:hypothetical protein